MLISPKIQNDKNRQMESVLILSLPSSSLQIQFNIFQLVDFLTFIITETSFEKAFFHSNWVCVIYLRSTTAVLL